MVAYPTWTKPSKDPFEHRGLWALGVEPVALRLEDSQLPGYTGGTIYVRYYSFFCWAFWTLAEDTKERGGQVTPDRQKAWLVRLENMLRSATLQLNPTIGQLIGVTKARRVNDLPDSATIDVTEDEAASAFIPAQYSASFGALGLGRSTDRSPVIRITPLAQELAQAFDASVRSVLRGLSDRKVLVSQRRVAASFIRRVAPALAIRPVNPGEPEHRPLTDLLFRMREEPNDRRADRVRDRARSRTLGLLLEMADQSDGRLSEPRMVRHVLASGFFPDGKRFQVSPVYKADFLRLQRYQERQQIKLGLYGLWREITRYLESCPEETASIDRIQQVVWRQAESSQTLREWLSPRALTKSVAMALDRVRSHRSELDRRRRPPGFVLTERIIEQSTEADVDRVGAAIAVLILSVVEWEELLVDVTIPKDILGAHRDGGRVRISLESLAEDTASRRELSLREYVQWLVETCVLGQAVDVATAKLERGDFRYFVLRDGGGFRLVRRQRPGSYLAYDGTRIAAGYALLRDLGLVTWENGLHLRPAGRTTMQRVRAHHEQIRATS